MSIILGLSLALLGFQSGHEYNRWIPLRIPILEYYNGVISSVSFSSAGNGFLAGLGVEHSKSILFILHTSDSGLTWLEVTPPHFDYQQGTAPVVSCISDSKCIFGAGNDLRITTNAGKSWKRIQFAKNINIQYLHFFNQSIGYISSRSDFRSVHRFLGDSDNFLLKTTNGGKNWSNTLPRKCSSLLDLKVAFADSQNGVLLGFPSFLGFQSFNKVPTQFYRTTNGGVSWDSVYSTDSNIHEILGFGQNYYTNTCYSTDNGSTWINYYDQRKFFYFDDQVVDGFDIFPLEDVSGIDQRGHPYLLAKHEVFTSQDNGKTWNLAGEPVFSTSFFPGFLVGASSNTSYIFGFDKLYRVVISPSRIR